MRIPRGLGKATPNTRSVSEATPSMPKYQHPKIILVDLKFDARQALEAEGYNVSTGSFGTPYKVTKGDYSFPVIPNGKLRNFAEQEIVVVDLAPKNPLEKPVGEKVVSDGQPDVWAKCSRGVIDPRPRMMEDERNDAARIYANGGLFIVFAAPRSLQDQFIGQTQGYHWAEKLANFPFDNWSFLHILEDLKVRQDKGREISMSINTSSPVGQVLAKHIKNAEFSCTVRPELYVEDRWLTLAQSKYGDPVAGAVSSSEGKGIVLILPQIEDKAQLLVDLLKNAIPDFMPHLFPEAEGARWVQRPEYEVPEIQGLKNQVLVVKEEAQNKVAELEKAIEAEREKTSYLHDLISATGDNLVAAVKKALEVIGFKSVVDVDKEMEKAGDRGPKNEDLQIHDELPVLLVEVKGIGGLPADEDALAVGKYLAPRMKEWSHTDVEGLSVINHQRHIPALDRDNRMPFRKLILDSAEKQGIGLMTAWDLHKLLRSYMRNGWQPEHVKPIFSGNGRILPVPVHYEPVGVIERFIENRGVVGISVTEGALRHGDRIAFELPVEFVEQDIETLQIDNQQVEEVNVGSLAGAQTVLTKGQARVGTRVFRVAQTVS